MGNYENLKQSITEVIRTNGNQEITGAVLQSTLLTIISTVGANATFAGIATPTTNPGTPDGPVFYLASEGGTYTNFNAIELQDGLSVLMWDGTWSSQQIFGVDDEPTAESDNLVKSSGVFKERMLSVWRTFSRTHETSKRNNSLLKSFIVGDEVIIRLRNIYVEENNIIALQLCDYNDNVLLTINGITNGTIINRKYTFTEDCPTGLYVMVYTRPNSNYQYSCDILIDDYISYCQEIIDKFNSIENTVEQKYEELQEKQPLDYSDISYGKITDAGPAQPNIGNILIYYNPQDVDYYVKSMSIGYTGSIGDVVKIHIGIIDQRNNWIETSVCETTIKARDSNVCKIIPEEFIYVPKNNVIAVEFVAAYPKTWTYTVGDVEQYPPFISKRNLTDPINIAGRTDVEWGYYSVETFTINGASPFATKNEISDTNKSLSTLSEQVSVSKIFIDRATGDKYRIEVTNGALSLIAITYHNVLVIGNSFTNHGVSQDRWWANRGMAASVDANQYTQKLSDLLSLTSLDKLSGVNFEQNVNNTTYDFETNIPISSSNNYDLVIIQLGENSALTNRTNFVRNWMDLINYVITKCPHANIIQVIGWSTGDKLSAINEACTGRSIQVINCYNETMTGNLRTGDYVTETGNSILHSVPSLIVTHPSDVGMTLIANKIASSLGFTQQAPLYDITINGAVGGVVTSCYNQWPSNGVVSFKIEAENGYQLSSIAIKDAQDNTITHQSLSNDNGDYICIFMPQSNITVTPTFSLI